VDKPGAGHPYQVIAASIATKIEDGELSPGEQLPSVRALAKEYDTTAATVQKVIKTLTEDGYVKTIPGRGIFVVNPETDPDAALARKITNVANMFGTLGELLLGLEQHMNSLKTSKVDRPFAEWAAHDYQQMAVAVRDALDDLSRAKKNPYNPFPDREPRRTL